MVPTLALLAVAAVIAILGSTRSETAAQPVSSLLDRVMRAVQSGAAAAVALRRDLHRHPELSGAEERTARLVAERMRALGIEVRTRVGGHGVVALLKGGRPGSLVAYRADMDAVRSTDTDPVDFRSLVPGVRHQCGHDVHTAIGVALAAALADVRNDLPGSVLFLFQPAEERGTGAKAMLADGVWANDRPVAIYAVHTAPFEVGQVATRPGPMMAARDGIRIRITGPGDRQSAEAAVRAAVQRLSTITDAQAMNAPADEDFLYFRSPDGSRRENDTTLLEVTVMLASTAARERARDSLKRELSAIALPDIVVTHEYEAKLTAGVMNEPGLTARAVAALTTTVGAAAVLTSPIAPPAFSEDFGSFQDQVPGVYFFLGVSNAAKGYVGMPHSPNYVADDDAIAFGARAMAAVLLDRMQPIQR
jgi:amidohydrolase